MEALYICTRCQKGGFTQQGLTRHQGNGGRCGVKRAGELALPGEAEDGEGFESVLPPVKFMGMTPAKAAKVQAQRNSSGTPLPLSGNTGRMPVPRLGNTGGTPVALSGEIARDFAAVKAQVRELYALAQRSADQCLLIGISLCGLHAKYGVATGGDRRSKTHRASLIATWPELVEEQLGISHDTANRWMRAARAQMPLLANRLGFGEGEEGSPIEVWMESVQTDALAVAVREISEDKTLEQLMLPLDGGGRFDSTKLVGKDRDAWAKIAAISEPWEPAIAETLGYSEEEHTAWQPHAQAARAKVESGEVTPARAWAGVRGRASTFGVERKGTDHYKNLFMALAKLRTSLPHYDAMSPDDRSELEIAFQDLDELIPGPWKTFLSAK